MGRGGWGRYFGEAVPFWGRGYSVFFVGAVWEWVGSQCYEFGSWKKNAGGVWGCVYV